MERLHDVRHTHATALLAPGVNARVVASSGTPPTPSPHWSTGPVRDLP